MVAEDASADFGQSVNDLRYLGTEDVFDVLDGVVGVFDHVVEQGCADAGRAQSHLLAGYLRHGDGVQDIGLAR